MTFDTKYFGVLECKQSDIIKFETDILGFEDEKEFVFIRFEEGNDDVLCMQSVHTPYVAFVVMNPFSLKSDYNPVLIDEDLKYFGVEKGDELNYYVTCAIRKPMDESTANFRSPFVFNPKTNICKQIILENAEYSFHQRFDTLKNNA